MSTPEHVTINRAYWQTLSAFFDDLGHRCWSRPDISWGIWNLPESEVQAFSGIDFEGKDVVELGCGTAYFSAWFARLGAKPVGVDVTPNQLANARRFQQEFGIEFPLIEANAEQVPLQDACFDVAFSEYGASIWCDPERWIAEASRLLRPGGVLVFLRGSTLFNLCVPNVGAATTELQRDWSHLRRMVYDNEPSVEFHLPPGEMVRLLKRCGFVLEDLIELFPPDDAEDTPFDFITLDWARRWPCEEIWRVRKIAD